MLEVQDVRPRDGRDVACREPDPHPDIGDDLDERPAEDAAVAQVDDVLP